MGNTVPDNIRFDDGAAYERMMGTWSRITGSAFLDWVQPPRGLRWLDVGCGNGAFTQLLVERCAPAAVTGMDPSEAQLAYARSRAGTQSATYLPGDAMQLPLADAQFDAAVMALVLFFVPDPLRGAAEMARVVREGGLLCAYLWDVPGGGLPHELLRDEMRALGMPVASPPSAEVSELSRLRAVTEAAGWRQVETTTLDAQRTFRDFDDAWETSILGSTIRSQVENMPAADREELKARVRARCRPDAQGRVTFRARANAVKGRVAR